MVRSEHPSSPYLVPRLGLVRVGEEHPGVVRHIAPFGAFIELVQHPIDGVLLFDEGRVGYERSRFVVGGSVRVVVLGVEEHEMLPGRGSTKLMLGLAEGGPAEPGAAADGPRL